MGLKLEPTGAEAGVGAARSWSWSGLKLESELAAHGAGCRSWNQPNLEREPAAVCKAGGDGDVEPLSCAVDVMAMVMSSPRASRCGR